MTSCCILLCRLLKVAQQLDQLFTDSLIIRSVGVEKDPGRSIMQLQSRDLVTAHVESVLVLSFSKKVERHDHDHIRILKLTVVPSRMQHVQIDHPIIVSGSFRQILRILLLDFHIIRYIPNILTVHIEIYALILRCPAKLLFCLCLILQRYRMTKDNFQHILQGFIIRHYF